MKLSLVVVHHLHLHPHPNQARPHLNKAQPPHPLLVNKKPSQPPAPLSTTARMSPTVSQPVPRQSHPPPPPLQPPNNNKKLAKKRLKLQLKLLREPQQQPLPVRMQSTTPQLDPLTRRTVK